MYVYAANNPINLRDALGLAIDDLKSMEALAAFQAEHGGSSQGTLVLIRTKDGNHYMIEQETNTKTSEAAEALGITYIPQRRATGQGYDAEMRFLDYAESNAIDVSGAEVWVSKDICRRCAQQLLAKKLKLRTPVTKLGPRRRWRAPGNPIPLPTPRGEFVGRRSETEQLEADLPDSYKAAATKRSTKPPVKFQPY
jgi:hypothetical protein